MVDKAMKQMEAMRLKLFTALANKLDWRLAMAALFAVTVYLDGKIDRSHDALMAQIGVTHEIAVRNSEKIEQTRQIAMEGREIAMENSRKLDLLLMQNQIQQGATNTNDNTPASPPSELPEFNTPNSTPTTNPTQRS